MPASRAERAAIAHIVQRLSAQSSALDADLVQRVVRDTRRRFDGHPTREFVPITGDQPAGGAPSREEPECHVATVVDLPAEGLTVAEVLTHYPQLAARTSAGVLRGRTGRTPDTDHAASTR